MIKLCHRNAGITMQFRHTGRRMAAAWGDPLLREMTLPSLLESLQELFQESPQGGAIPTAALSLARVCRVTTGEVPTPDGPGMV